MLTKTPENDVLYFCSLVEYIARVTKNHRKDIIEYFSFSDITVQLHDAEINHCLSFEEVSDEIIEKFHIKEGNYDNISNCKYKIPSYVDIGRVYKNLIMVVMGENSIEATIKEVFSSFISDEISDFNSDVYYSNSSYIMYSYLEGKMLD